MAVLVRAQGRRIEVQRHHVDIPVAHPVLRHQHFAEGIDVAVFAAQDHRFQAVGMVQHHVGG